MRASWIRVKPDELFNLLSELTAEEAGAFTRLLMAMYAFDCWGHGMPVGVAASYAGIHPLRWPRLREALFEKGFYFEIDGVVVLQKGFNPAHWGRRAPSKAERDSVFAACSSRCAKCGTTEALTIDHIVPKALRGGDHLENLQVLCRPCNLAKGRRLDV